MHSFRLSELFFIAIIGLVQFQYHVSGFVRYDDPYLGVARGQQYRGYSRGQNPDYSNKRSKCQRMPYPKNGLMRVRNGGRTLRYECDPGYTLLGEKRLVCRGITWDKNPPKCISPGCPLNETAIENAHVEQQYEGALVKFECYSGYVLSGSSVISCDGHDWNASIPVCSRNEEDASIGSCNFEVDFCGWVNSQNDNFDWKLNILSTPSALIGTGPSFDHTLGLGKKGHYLYLESSSPQSADDTAVLISPYFAMVTNETSCFTFWYHMYGGGIGRLNVYVNNILNFTESGNHGNRWIRGVVPLAGRDMFKIKIEGVRGPSYNGDIAIDDFAIAEGSACDETETSPLLGSCSGRCFTDTMTDDNACSCSESCQMNSTCCADFYNICSIGAGMSTAQAGPTSSSLESKSIDTSTDLIIASTTSKAIINSTDNSSTLTPLFTTAAPYTILVTTGINKSTIIDTINFENKNDTNGTGILINFKNSDKNITGNQTDSETASNLNQNRSSTTINDGNTTPTWKSTPLQKIPVISGNSSTQKIINNESLSTTNVSNTLVATKASPTVNNSLSVNTSTSNNHVTMRGNNSITNNSTMNKNNTAQVNNNTSKVDKIEAITQKPVFPTTFDIDQQLNAMGSSELLKKILEKLNRSSVTSSNINSAVKQIIMDLNSQKYDKILGNNQSPFVNSTKGEVTKNPLNKNATTVLGNVTLTSFVRTTKIPFNLTSTTKFNNLTKTTTTTTTKIPFNLTSTTKSNNITTTTRRIFTTTTTTKPILVKPTIKAKLPINKWQKKSNSSFNEINPKMKNDVFSKNVPKSPSLKLADRDLTQYKSNNTRFTQNITFYTTSNRISTVKSVLRTTTQAAHMSVIKTKVDMIGRGKNGKWRKNSDKDRESHAPYVINQQTDNKKSNVAIISVFVLVSIVGLVIAVFTCKRRMNRDRSLDDDSDVQFLTSDELINFNLARPSPDRQTNSETFR